MKITYLVNMKIKFFKPYLTGNEIKYIGELLENNRDVGGDGYYTKKVHELLEKNYKVKKALLTTSCTTALELAVRILNLPNGSEVIVPSFTFSSTVNAILLPDSLKVVFCEIEKDTLNIDPADIERKITPKTKALMIVHYAGVSCDMDKIMKLAKKHDLKVIEDAAQGIEAKFKDKYLGTIGDLGCVSFHETKNITSGEGGALFINRDDKDLIERAEIYREKGTNRSKFFRGQIDKYSWVDLGSSVLPSDILAAFLLAQLEAAKKITKERLKIYNFYKKNLAKYEKQGFIKLPTIPSYAKHNGHIFYILFKSLEQRTDALCYLKQNGVSATFHYVPLHNAPEGKKLGYKDGDFKLTERVSDCLLRLPIYAGMSVKEQKYVVLKTKEVLDQQIKRKGEKHA